MKKLNLKGLSRSELSDFILSLGEKNYRSKQIWSWIYQKGVNDFDDMTNISKSFRNVLKEHSYIGTLKLAEHNTSSQSGTQKFMWELEDGLNVESVLIPEQKRKTICISTQVGCAMGCKFCATGTMGLVRNLKPFEIIDQILSIKRLTNIKPTNIVVMGMGEPFANYDNLIKALEIIKDNEGIALGHRKITISTAGLIPQIRRFIKEKQPYNLAISLNAASDSIRSRIMPVNKKYGLKDLVNSAKQYAVYSRKRITFEYVLLKGINDKKKHADQIKKLLKGIPCKINLIPYNETTENFQRPPDDDILMFAEYLKTMHATVTLRLSKGDDIQGACGQLVVKKQRRRK